ncbi:hypothetical protein [Falsihalocynthiibacter arcticus]|uniref:hypothetical protein n=1 Tax=Falsihalocynthiibacter arcticus TaxID=1579316 RepID=UPI003000FE6E
MRKFVKIGVVSFALSAFAIAPAIVVMSADVAIAKNDNGKSGGNSGGNGNSGSKGKSDNKGKASTGNSGSSSGKSQGGKSQGGKSSNSSGNQSLKSLGNKLKSGFGLFGAPKKTKTVRSNSVATTKPSTGNSKSFDHPSNLGKMNGAINSSPQAKLAHIKNGNFNGPVGIAAAYALADYDYDTAHTDYEEAQSVVQTFGPLAERYSYVAGYDVAVEELARLDTLEIDPASEEYSNAAAAADPDAYQSAVDAIYTAEAAAIIAGIVLNEASVFEQLAAAIAVEEPVSTTRDVAEANLLALYKGDEESLTDREKELLIQSINLPTAEQIEGIITASENEDESD